MNLNNKQEFKLQYGEHEVTIETGRLAKQADGSVLVSSGGTQVLVSVVSAREASPGQDFFPLMVDYKEKFYAAGKFLGGFHKRETRPGNHEILLMRMIDRPFRPLFPEGYLCETIVTAQVLSYDGDADPEILAALGTSAAFMISDIPLLSSAGFCKIGKVNGKLILNPSNKQLEESTIDMIVAASDNAILMVEGEANEVSEAEMLEAIEFAHTNIKRFCALATDMAKKIGKKKREFTPIIPNKTLMAEVTKQFNGVAQGALGIVPKLERQLETEKITKAIKAAISETPEKFGLTADSDFSKEAKAASEYLFYHMMRNDIVEKEKRIGGRKINEIRKIEVEAGLLKKPHGSALFTRGETQVLSTITLGGKDGEQLVDRMSGLSYDKFYLHYTFMPFSVGEARGYRGVGRREVGHGNLAERALKKVIDRAKCPYTIRVACEVLESNGSSSMGSVCAGSLALLDAGVAISSPVAGIAMGLVKEGEKYKILSDILGDEDHLGDMDFKVAGTHKGITAIQMDIKIAGITSEIMKTALSQAQTGRIHILGEMSKALSAPRADYKQGVPLIETIQVKPENIGAIIGPGGKNIKGLQEKFGVTIECEDSGNVKILGVNREVVVQVRDLIDMQINGPKIGSEYDAKVVSLKEYGAFVDIVGGISGLVHVSEISNDRVQDVNDYLSEGDSVKVKVLDVDRFGKIKFSIKAVQALESKNPKKAPAKAENSSRND